jgi:hypothetical protein
MAFLPFLATPVAKRARRISPGSICLCVCAGMVAVLSPLAAWGQQTVSQGLQTIMMPPKPTSVILPAANRAPDANDQMQMRQQQLKRASYEAANAERMRQLDSDSALILKLASELKAEIDKTPQDTLSLSIVRKADEIERLAHNVQVKMKLTVGSD